MFSYWLNALSLFIHLDRLSDRHWKSCGQLSFSQHLLHFLNTKCQEHHTQAREAIMFKIYVCFGHWGTPFCIPGIVGLLRVFFCGYKQYTLSFKTGWMDETDDLILLYTVLLFSSVFS